MFPHSRDFPCTFQRLSLRDDFTNHSPVQHLLRIKLTGGHHIIIAPLSTEVVLGHQSHAVPGHQSPMGMGNLHDGVLRRNGHITEHGRIPVEARPRNCTDGWNIQVKNHILNEIGIVKILMLESLGRQLRIGLPAVGIRFDHPCIPDVGKDDDLILYIHRQDPHQLRDRPVGHARMLHGAVVGLPCYLQL